jgi:hypothetical protein
MLFKTLSSSVYGIDAHLVEVEVEVEVDVGSARMQDFNVVGLPDNAVKESRERIKSALRNCGFEFPHGQGVTINLAPADVRKEGSAFDLPMALGQVGCMGHFLGKPLPAERAGGDAATIGRRVGNHCAGRSVGYVSLSIHAGGGHEPMPLRLFRRPHA